MHPRAELERPAPRLSLLIAVAALATACSPRESTRARAVVIGIDGADWRVIEPLIDAGRMPHLAALRERGSSGPIATLVDFPLSPVIWTSVATGKVPAKHGITWFLVDRPDGTRAPVRSHNRKARALWNIASERGLRPVSIGWWASYPAEDVGEGVLVSDAIGFHGFGRTARDGDTTGKVHPHERYAEMEALIPPEQQVESAFARRFLRLTDDEYRSERFDPARFPRADPGNPIHLFQQYAVTAHGYTAIAEKLLAEPYDLFLLYYEQVDSLSHLFMKHAPPRLEWIPEPDFERYRDVVTEWYAHQDELLGRVLAKIDLETTAVFVLSDHGFKSGERRIRSPSVVDIRTAHLDHEPDGILLAAGPGIRAGGRVEGASVLDLTPTLLHYLGLPVAKDMDGKVLTELFEPAEARAITYVASYENAAEDAAPVAEEYAEDALAENLAQLEALGYVGESDASKSAGGSSPEIHNNLARIHMRAGELDQAIAEFEKSLALQPHGADAILGLAAIAGLRGNRDRAEQLVRVALATDPHFPPAIAQLAALRREAGDLDEAIRLYREALAIDDSSPALYLGLGDCLNRAGLYTEAEAAFERVLELEPDSFAAHYNRGVTTSLQGRDDEAIEHFERALAMSDAHPLMPAALNNLATIHLESGDRARAIARWEDAVAAAPPVLEPRYNLALRRIEDGRTGEAIALLEDAARLSPNHERVQTLLGLSYLRDGRGDEAYRSLALVHRLYPRNWEAPLAMAALHAANGRPAQAQPLLDAALREGGSEARRKSDDYPALASLIDSHTP